MNLSPARRRRRLTVVNHLPDGAATRGETVHGLAALPHDTVPGARRRDRSYGDGGFSDQKEDAPHG